MFKYQRIPKFLLIILVVIIVTVLILSIYCLNAIWIKKAGINLSPSKVIKPPEDIKIFLQNDEKWGEDNLGNSRYKLASHGCLLSVIATSLNNFDYETNPNELNQLFTKENVYTPTGDIIWYKINEAIPAIDYDYRRIFSKNTIQKDLKNGLFPIVMVKYKKTGIYHWVLIVGSNEEDFLIVDPLYKDKNIASIDLHGKVYAYRVLKKIK